MFRIHSHCRACGFGAPTGPPGIKAAPSGEKLIPVFSLGNQPLANAFAGSDDFHSAFYPLEVLLCPKCGLAQLSATVPPSVLYSTYLYTTSRSDTMHRHFDMLWRELQSECNPESIVEIGSNDGYFLEFARSRGAHQVCGIDPAQNLAEIASANGIQTFCGVFDKETAAMARSCVPSPDVIIARHVFCHIDDWRGFINSIGVLATKNTLVIIEIPYVMDLLKNCDFDTIYHEHTSYFNLRAMVALLERTPFRIQKVVRFPVHGGAIAVMLRRYDHEKPSDSSVFEMLEQENISEQTWKEFAARAQNRIHMLRQTVRELVSRGKRVVGYGASAKSTVWINALGFTRKDMAFICDSTPGKWNKISPGSDIPITDEGALLRELPDYAVLWSWNYSEEIIAKNQLWQDKGGKFILAPRL